MVEVKPSPSDAKREFRQRIELLYKRWLGTDSTHGAIRWFAEQAGIHETTVQRWCGAWTDRVPPPWAWKILAEIENRAGPRRKHLEADV